MSGVLIRTNLDSLHVVCAAWIDIIGNGIICVRERENTLCSMTLGQERKETQLDARETQIVMDRQIDMDRDRQRWEEYVLGQGGERADLRTC